MLTEKQKNACMTVTDLASALGVSKPIAYDIANRADFPAIRYGRRIIIPCAAFDTWLSETAAKGNIDLKRMGGR